jgi:aryl-alcohol dehydrogenase-like predicted oxidoreductase
MSEIALGWVLRQRAITSVIIGARSVAELDANLAALDVDIEEDVWDELDRATEVPPTYPTDFYRRMHRRAELSE